MPAKFDLQNEDVPPGYWTKLKALAEPATAELFSKLGSGETGGAWLIEKGLAEEVPDPRSPSHGPCLQDAEFGHVIVKRGPHAKTRARGRKVKMIPVSRLRVPDPFIGK